jgi:alkanesulfonate monooxygenase SsuD/methylene tetrahydromethanopterin reductase-like flavin-dependent oxidoreductase (luciferase family)
MRFSARAGLPPRAKAAAEDISIRELIVEVTARHSFVGSPATVAATINDFVQADAR